MASAVPYYTNVVSCVYYQAIPIITAVREGQVTPRWNGLSAFRFDCCNAKGAWRLGVGLRSVIAFGLVLFEWRQHEP